MALISVIVPLYNVEAFLSRCVDSILAQTFADFDVILVDDGSTDGSGAICDAYAAQDSRVHVIHQKNSGVGVARNTGLDWVMTESDSHWITFVDSDDWIHPEMLKMLLDTAVAYNTKFSVCGFQETDGDPLTFAGEQTQTEVWKASDFYQNQLILATVPWGKLYAKSCFEALRYPVGTYYDDEFVTYRILFMEEAFPVISAPLYAYFYNPAGITKKAWIPKRLDAWKAYEQQLAYFRERGMADMVKFRLRGYLENAMVNLRAAEENPEKYAKEIKFIEKRMRSVIRRAWKADCIQFWVDFDMLHRFYPLLTLIYRRVLEWKVRRERRKQ